MARREALQELQNRIAGMLQKAGSDKGVTASWLGVRIGARRVLLPLQQSGEIQSASDIQSIAYAKPWFLGVVALRGNIVGVVNIAPFLDAAPVDPVLRAQPEQPQARRLVVLNEALGLNVALRVEALEGLRGRDAFLRSGPPASSAPAYFGSVFTDPQGCIWHEVNLQALAQTPEFLDIAVHPDAGALAAA
ncbi:chemotaxis protein CheW [Brachymonas sp. M4Q-1]|uniref:chemotaxis protein CheW n=1 Tax=Brachymonas sp. M4Q-1 TaxID=3416906 RepID=UPI003CFAF6A9